MASASRTLVVGDVHGCPDELEDLLAAADFQHGRDELVLAGDLVNKGPDSPRVVALARRWRARAVLGNHDDRLLDARRGVPLKPHLERLARLLSPDDWAYLESLPLFLELPQHGALVVHGGLLTLRSLDAHGHGSSRVADGVPWASRWVGPPFVLFGHDAVRGLQRHPHAVGLDSGCVYGKALSAWWLPEHRLVQVPARKAYVAVRDGD